MLKKKNRQHHKEVNKRGAIIGPSFVLEDTEGQLLSPKAVKFIHLVQKIADPFGYSPRLIDEPMWVLQILGKKKDIVFRTRAHPDYYNSSKGRKILWRVLSSEIRLLQFMHNIPRKI